MSEEKTPVYQIITVAKWRDDIARERWDALLPDLVPLIEDLLADEHIHYEDYVTEWECHLCSVSIPAIWDPPGTLQSLTVGAFPHDKNCPVNRARRILSLLPKKGTSNE